MSSKKKGLAFFVVIAVALLIYSLFKLCYCQFSNYELGATYGTGAMMRHNDFWEIQKHIKTLIIEVDDKKIKQDIIWFRSDRSAGEHRWNDTLSFSLSKEDGILSSIIYRPFEPSPLAHDFMKGYDLHFSPDTLYLPVGRKSALSKEDNNLFFCESFVRRNNNNSVVVSWTLSRGVTKVESQIEWLPSFKVLNEELYLLRE